MDYTRGNPDYEPYGWGDGPLTDGEFEAEAQRHNNWQIRDFVTKDSGAKSEYASGMQRDTRAGKPYLELMYPEGVPFDEQMIVRLGRLYARGAEKYGERNWEKACTPKELEHYKGSLHSHMIHVLIGTDDGEDHAAAVLWNLIALVNTRRNISIAKETEFARPEHRVPGIANQDDEDPDVALNQHRLWINRELARRAAAGTESVLSSQGDPLHDFWTHTAHHGFCLEHDGFPRHYHNEFGVVASESTEHFVQVVRDAEGDLWAEREPGVWTCWLGDDWAQNGLTSVPWDDILSSYKPMTAVEGPFPWDENI
jgi:Domain of unknown function (DUF5664)